MYIQDCVPINNSWLNEVKSKSTLVKGKDYANKQRIQLTSCEKRGDCITLCAQASSENSDEQYNVIVEFEEDGELFFSECDCPAFYEYNGICKHCVATILTYNQFYTSVIEPKQGMDNAAAANNSSVADVLNATTQRRSHTNSSSAAQNSKGTLTTRSAGTLKNNDYAHYYSYQHQRRIDEARIHQEKMALQRTTDLLSAYKHIVVNEVKALRADNGQTQYVTLVPILEMDEIRQGVLLGFQIRRKSEQEMAAAKRSETVCEREPDCDSPFLADGATEQAVLPVNRFPHAYVIKAIDELLSSVIHHESMSFGKELSFKAVESAFDAMSLKWLGFLERHYNECKRITKTYQCSQKTRRIRLTDSALDEMFALFGDAWFRMSDNASEYRKLISSQIPKLTVGLKKGNDGAVTLTCPKIDTVYLGVDSSSDRQFTGYNYGAYWLERGRRPAKPPRHVYVKKDNQLLRFSSQASVAIAPLLLELMDECGKLTFPKEQTADLFAHLLPEVSKYIQILDPSGLHEREKTDTMTGRILLDAPDRERITAVLLAGYHGIWLDTHSGKAVGQTAQDSSTNMSYDVAGLDISVIKRDYHAEQRFLAQAGAALGFHQNDIISFLATDENGSLAAGSQEQPIVVTGNDCLYQLVKSGVAKLQTIGDVLITQKLRSLTIEPPRKITVGVTLESGLLKLNIDAGGIDIEEMQEVMRAYREKKTYYRLKNGSFLDLSSADADAYAGMKELHKVEQGLLLSKEDMLNGEVEVPAFRAMYLDGLFSDAVSLGYSKDEAFQSLTSRINNFAHAAFPVPQTLENVLRPYQKTGYQWLRCLESYSFCGILADDMGLGKSVQLLSVLLAHYDAIDGTPADNQLPSLIVCPSSLVLNWKKEAEKFAPSLAVRVVQGTKAARQELINDIQPCELVITSYDLLRRDESEYKRVQFHYFAIDEAQYIKNHTTQAAKTVKKINCKQRFALTGTPIENRLSELWSIFDFLMPGYLYRYSRFKQQFETPITKNNDEIAKSNLRRMILPFVLRRLKSEVLKELPPKTTTVVPVELGNKQMELYNAMLLTGLNALKSEKDRPEGVAKMQVLALLTKLRRLCCSPSLCFDSFKYGSAKLDICMELLEQTKYGGHHVLLFSQYTDMLDLIEARVKNIGMSYLRLQGSTPVKDRLKLVDKFNKGETDVFLISLKAGGTGLNLTAADTVMHYDPWWNLAAQDQATDRAYRIGQEKKVQVYKLIAQNTIEEKILKLQAMKKDLAAIVDSENDEVSLMSMSTDEIVELLKDR